MKYIKTDKFYELNAMNNFQGLGQENLEALERGEEVELEQAPEHLISGKYIEEVKGKK
tara:strand:- start:17 stop:190 length:174 start_codon:yes stop_codon:yes gene_type:complete